MRLLSFHLDILLIYGVCKAQPHNSVSESSFYKHIDCDLPDAERVRQLLIWCSSRAASNSTTSSPKDPPQALPPLSAQGIQLLKSVQDDVVRMLAERKIDLSLYPPEASGSVVTEPQKENEQNVTNRGWEVTYGTHIQRCVSQLAISLMHLTREQGNGGR